MKKQVVKLVRGRLGVPLIVFAIVQLYFKIQHFCPDKLRREMFVESKNSHY